MSSPLSFATLTVPACAQELLLSNVRGIVTDAKGGVVVGASVSLANQTTGLTRNAMTDETGSYLFNNIVPGVYTLAVEMSGFKKHTETALDVTASRTVRVDVSLQVGELTQTVEVAAEAPLVETETPTVSFSARNEIMNRVPTAGSIQAAVFRIPTCT